MKSAEELNKRINSDKKGAVGKEVNRKIKEFRKFRRASCDGLFSELCFCLLTANCSAENCIRVQKEIGGGFIKLSEKKLAAKLKKAKYRFPNKRAEYVVCAREKKEELKKLIDSEKDCRIIREWLIKNIRGLGMKEASHFLRNTGFGDVAIIDFHIIDILAAHKIIDKPENLSKKRYLEIEKRLEKIAQKTDLSLGELDLYLWHMETGKILK